MKVSFNFPVDIAQTITLRQADLVFIRRDAYIDYCFTKGFSFPINSDLPDFYKMKKRFAHKVMMTFSLDKALVDWLDSKAVAYNIPRDYLMQQVINHCFTELEYKLNI